MQIEEELRKCDILFRFNIISKTNRTIQKQKKTLLP